MVSAPPAWGWLRFSIERTFCMISLRNSVPLCGLNKPNDLRMAIRNSQILNRKSSPELASTNFDIRNSVFVVQYSSDLHLRYLSRSRAISLFSTAM
jgi:hypothetical protein